MRHTGKRAFTLVEVSIAMTIGIFLLIGMYTLYKTGIKSFRKTDANLEAVLSASVVMTVITDDLRGLTLDLKDLKEGKEHSIPFKVNENGGQLVGEITNKEPVLLSKGGKFSLKITDPEQIGKDKNKTTTVEYSLEKENTGTGKDIFHLVRKVTGDKPDTRTYRESYVKEVAFQVLHTKEDPKDGAAPAAGDESVVYLRVTVVGASTSLMEGGPTGSIQADSDYYQIPITGLYALDCISELMTARGLGRYWQPVRPKKP